MQDTDEPNRGDPRAKSKSTGVLIGVCLTLVVGSLIAGSVLLLRADSQPVALGVLPGEFEHQEALVFSWTAEGFSREMILSSATAVSDDIEIIVLVPDEVTRLVAHQALLDTGIKPARFRLIEAPIQSPWTRDFGPLATKSFGGGFSIIDTDYGVLTSDASDDAVPSFVAAALNLPLVHAALVIENGNVLSNGAGLCVTTEKTVQMNKDRAYVTHKFGEVFGANEVVYLEPLAGEINGHVDMFATFTAPDAIVVGEYLPGRDPVNAAILDRNAKRLAAVRTVCGPLRVFRIPMPDRIEGLWMTHTNVVFANGTLLFPTFSNFDTGTRERAKAVFRKLLPQWRIVEIDCTAFIYNGGAIHCLAINLYRAPRIVTNP